MKSDSPWEEIERLYNQALELPARERQDLLAQASPEVRQFFRKLRS